MLILDNVSVNYGAIEALTGISPREGEAVVVVPQGDTLRVLGRVTF